MGDVLTFAGLFGGHSIASALVCGTLFGFMAGLIPGIGGRVGLILAIPFAMSFQSAAGAVFLIAMHAVVHTSGSIPSIAYGLLELWDGLAVAAIVGGLFVVPEVLRAEDDPKIATSNIQAG